MEKTISPNLGQAFFLYNIVQATVKAATEEDLIKKISFFDSMKAVKDSRKAYLEMTDADQKKAFEDTLESVIIKFTFESDTLDWLKTKWKEAPANYKAYNQVTGELVSTGFVSEEECRLYYDVKMALEDAQLVKESVKK